MVHTYGYFSKKRFPPTKLACWVFRLLDKAMEVYPNLSFDSYDRLFPNQDILPEGGFGNLIALPLQREARLAGNSSFVDAELNIIEDQWQYLAQIKRLSRQELNKLLSEISPNASLISEQDSIDTRPPWEVTAKPKPLVLENPPQPITITLANHIYFDMKALPSALSARLRRLASFSNPVFFKTQALRFSFRIDPEHTQFKFSDTIPTSIFLSWYRCFLPCYTQ
jgi:hypothetical protein